MYTRQEMCDQLDDPGLVLDADGTCPLSELTASIDETCRQIEDQDDPAVVLVRLQPSPTNTRSWPGNVSIREVNRWERAVRRLERTGAVSVALAATSCAGPALDLLLASDYRIATADTRLLLPVNDGQFWPGMGVHRLVNQVGLARARQLVLWGGEILAEQAVAIGLIDEITSDPAAATQAAVVMLGRVAGAEHAIRRQLLLEAATTSYEDALGAHLAACDRELRRLRRIGEG